jgi:metal-responsive CopG/Arc/MetJ family transcriptional regulator
VKDVVVSARLPAALVHKLDALCQVAVQRRSQVLRLLIVNAREEDLPRAWRELSPDERRLLAESQ